MTLLALLLCACTTSAPPPAPRPEGVPEAATEIRLTGEDLLVDGRKVAPRTDLERDLVDGLYVPLLDALPPGGDEAWIAAPADTPWMVVRKLVVTADEAGRPARWVSAADGPAYGPSRKPDARFRPTCPDDGLAVEGVSRRLVIELFTGSYGSWAEAAVHFAPTVEGAAALSLPRRCWRDADCALAGPDRAACEAARGTPVADQRVPVAGPVGCILPIRKAPGQEAAWPDELAAHLGELGITARDEATLVIEAGTPWSVVLAVMEGFERAGLPPPALGMPLVEGHEQPPPCTIATRSAADLRAAGARWLGSRLPAPDPPGE